MANNPNINNNSNQSNTPAKNQGNNNQAKRDDLTTSVNWIRLLLGKIIKSTFSVNKEIASKLSVMEAETRKQFFLTTLIVSAVLTFISYLAYSNGMMYPIWLAGIVSTIVFGVQFGIEHMSQNDFKFEYNRNKTSNPNQDDYVEQVPSKKIATSNNQNTEQESVVQISSAVVEDTTTSLPPLPPEFASMMGEKDVSVETEPALPQEVEDAEEEAYVPEAIEVPEEEEDGEINLPSSSEPTFNEQPQLPPLPSMEVQPLTNDTDSVIKESTESKPESTPAKPKPIIKAKPKEEVVQATSNIDKSLDIAMELNLVSEEDASVVKQSVEQATSGVEPSVPQKPKPITKSKKFDII